MKVIDILRGLRAAKEASKESNCQKRHVGAVIINKGKIVGTGANFCNPKGGVCQRLHSKSMDDYDLCGPPVHAEPMAIVSMATKHPEYVGKRGNKMYIWGHEFSCPTCTKLIKMCKIKLIAVTPRRDLKTYVSGLVDARFKKIMKTARWILIPPSAAGLLYLWYKYICLFL